MTSTHIVDAPIIDSIVHLDPTKIEPDPENPRSSLRNIDALAASVANHGVLEPITVRPSGDTFMVLRGHRRHAAALKAGLTWIPCIVEQDGSEKVRAVTRIVENVQRDDFSPVEEARAMQQLFDLGMTDEEVTEALSVPVERVQAAAKVAASKTALAVTEKYDLSMDQAVVLAEFDGDNDIVKELTVMAKEDPGYFDQAAEQFRQERDRREAMDAAKAKAESDGYVVLTEPPAFSDSTIAHLQYLRPSAKSSPDTRLTRGNHAKCPGRAVYLIQGYGKPDVTFRDYCINFAEHGHVDERGTIATSPGGPVGAGAATSEKSEAEREKETLIRRVHRACMSAGRAAEVVRREFVRDLLKRKSVPKEILPFAITAMVSHNIGGDVGMFCILTGMTPPKERWSGDLAARAQFLKACTGTRQPLALFAMIAANVEGSWEPNSWEQDRPLRKSYLELLVKIGYTPSLVEKVILGKAKSEAVLAEADKVRAAAKKGASK